MIDARLKLNFPVGGGNVFDNENNEQLFCYSSAFSNTTDKLTDLSIEQLEAHIPIGYKSILICRRLKLIDHGIIVKELNITKGGKFILLANEFNKLFVPNWKMEIETATIYKPNFPDVSISSASWDKIDECTDYGISYSKIQNCKVVVSTILEIINWH